MSEQYQHRPVMPEQVTYALAPSDGKVIIDATYGGGGHARILLDSADLVLIAIDRDPEAVSRARLHSGQLAGLRPVQGCFSQLDEIAIEMGHDLVDGVLLDTGVSSFQLSVAGRGFSFMRDGPLDMRMSTDGASAAEAVNRLERKDLAAIFRYLGEEKAANRLATAIVRRRAQKPFATTLELANLAEQLLGCGGPRHPATRLFQALRIFVNDELNELARALVAAERILKPGGRLAVISFHSLEDRMVKTFLRVRSGLQGGSSRHAPEPEQPLPSFALKRRRSITASAEEVKANPQARSAHLRWAVRTSNPAHGGVGGILPPVPEIAKLKRMAA